MCVCALLLVFYCAIVCVAGTDETAIINLLTKRTKAQRQEILVKFKLMYGKVWPSFVYTFIYIYIHCHVKV